MASRDVLDFRNISLSGRHTSSLIEGGKPSSLGISQQERYALEKGHNSIHLASFPQEYKLPPLRSRGTVISTNLGEPYPSPSDSDQTSSSNAFLSEEEAKSDGQSLVNPKQNALYRYEMEGIVVYDMNSKTMEMIQKEPPPFIPFEDVKKEAESEREDQEQEEKRKEESDSEEQPEEETKSIESFEEQLPQKKDFPDEKDRLVYGALPEYPKKRAHIIQYTLGVPEQANIIQFDSRFENGNLAKAVKIGPFQYNLLLSNDFNTKGHTQWFYFKVLSKLEKGSSIKLNIVNLTKPDSLYSYGMKPCVYSETKKLMTGEGWHRDCFNISYSQNKIERIVRRSDQKETPQWAKFFYTISFSYTFKYDNDSVFFAHSFPYTYSRLQDFIHLISRDRKAKKYLRINTMCNSLAKNKCYLLTITEDIDSYITYEDERRFFEKSHAARKLLRTKAERYLKESRTKEAQKKKKRKQSPRSSQDVADEEEPAKEPLEQVMIRMARHSEKKGVVLTGRVHPGEPQASWVLQGTIQYLLSNEEDARILRRNFVFKIIPMLNPDGVIYGNYRCSLLGVDLNRKWLTPNKYLHPTIYYAKQLIKNFQEERQIQLFCDYHGHSRKMNTFTYGCTFSNSEFDGFKKNSMLRLFSLLLSQINPTFSFKDCHFRLEKCKESTARIVVFREFQIMNSFTLEATFFGADSHGINCEDPILKKSNEIEKAKQEREQKKNQKNKKKHKANKSGTNSPRRNNNENSKPSPRKGPLNNNKEEEKQETDKAKQKEEGQNEEEPSEDEATLEEEQLQVQDYFRVGHDVCRTLIQFLPIRGYRRKLYLCVQRIAQVLHQEYINCPFQLSMFTREKQSKGKGGQNWEQKNKDTQKKVTGNSVSIDCFSEGEGDETEETKKENENAAAMAGITELLIARKVKAIEERKSGKGDDASDTTSSDSEESVKERMFKKAKENKKKKQKLKEMMNRKKMNKQRKPGKDTGGIGAELRRSKLENTKKVQQIEKSPLPPSPVQKQKKKKIMVQKIPSPSTLYLKRQHTDFLARLTKATREEQTIREALPNLDMLPVVIDSKPIHSLYIRNRTKSQHAGAIEEDLEGFVDLDTKFCESPPIIREEKESPREGENIQKSLKISRINISQKPSLPPAILPAPLSPIKLSNQSPKRNFKRHQGAVQKKGPLMIVGSGNKPMDLHNFHRTSRVKLTQGFQGAEERRASSSYRNARLPKRESLTISPRKECNMRAAPKRHNNGLIMVRDQLAQFEKSSALLLEDNLTPKDSYENNKQFLMTCHGQFSDRATLHVTESRKKNGNETRSPSPDKPRLHHKSFTKLKKKASLKRLYNPRPTLRAALGVEDPTSPKLSTQQRLEQQLRKHEQELLEFLNYNSSFASKPRHEIKRDEKQRHQYPQISSPQIQIEEQSKKLMSIQSPNSSEANFAQIKEKQALKMAAFKSTTSSIQMYKPLLTPVLNKSVNAPTKEEAQRLALFFPSPSYIRALNPSERAEKKSQQFLSKIPSNLGSYEQSYYKAMEEYSGGTRKKSQKLNQTSDSWRKKKQLGMHDKSLQREQASLF